MIGRFVMNALIKTKSMQHGILRRHDFIAISHLCQTLALWTWKPIAHLHFCGHGEPNSLSAAWLPLTPSFSAPLCMSRPEGAVGIIWVYIGVYIKEWWCPKGGEIAIYRPVCGQCIARDSAEVWQKGYSTRTTNCYSMF